MAGKVVKILRKDVEGIMDFKKPNLLNKHRRGDEGTRLGLMSLKAPRETKSGGGSGVGDEVIAMGHTRHAKEHNLGRPDALSYGGLS